MSKTKDDRQFELLDERLIDIQGSLHKLPEILRAINNLDRKVLLKMSELSDAVAAIATDVTELQAAQQAIIDLLNKPNPDVQAAVAALQNADAAFDAIRDGLNAAAGAPTPEATPAPAPEG